MLHKAEIKKKNYKCEKSEKLKHQKQNNNKSNKNLKRNSQRQKKHKKETHSIFPKNFSHVFHFIKNS